MQRSTSDSRPPLTLGAWFRHDFIMETIALRTPSSILEIGPGMGAMGARLAEGRRYRAVEADETSREIARKAIGESAVVADLEAVGDERFDMVCAFEVIEHVPNDVEAVSSWASFLEPGGSILLSMPAFQERFGAWDEHVGHLRRYGPEDGVRLLQEAGLVEVEARVVGFPLSHLLETLRDASARRARSSDASASDRTAQSGRLLQPSLPGVVTQLVSAPFRQVQRRFPDKGTGLVVRGHLPGAGQRT